ncbi:MAG: hypothetical protein JW889_02170 [Verrucomicrobia bacterium]|nr:hypothetical protein [Verrucomicrobiota bacterium]
MSATIRTLAPALTAVLAVAALCAAGTWASTPATDPPPDTEAAAKEAAPARSAVSSDDVKQLAGAMYVEGLEAQTAGKLGLARAKLRAVLKLDPGHVRAKAALAQVDKVLGITETERMKEKLEARVPKVSFRDAELREVVEYLGQEAGVNIVFHAEALQVLAAAGPTPTGPPLVAGTQVPGRPDGKEPGVEPPADEAFVDETSGFAGFAAPTEPRRDLITIHLTNVPLREVLRYVLRYKGLKYVVEEYAVLIVPIGWEPDEDMDTEVFRLATGIVGARRLGADGTDQTGF